MRKPISVKFEAVFQPNQRRFCVSVKPGERKRRIVERMSIAKFMRWVSGLAPDKPMVISGITIETDDPRGPAMEQVRDYFKKVATSYQQAYWGRPENN